MFAKLRVRAVPKSGRNEIAGFRDGELVVRVTAAPESGRANAAVCAVVAEAVGVPKTRVSVIRGESSRHKTLSIQDLTDDELASILSPGDPGSAPKPI